MKKRLFSVLLAVLMIVSLLPTMAFAKTDGCSHTQKVTTITNGETYQMNLSGKNKGEFTFGASGKNWNIKNSDGKYLNAETGKLVLGDNAQTAWSYSKGAFSISEKTSGYWWGWIYIPGHGSKTVTTTYYLNTVTNGKLSTNYVCAELFKTVSGEHDYGKAIYVDQTNHKYVRKNCGDVKTEVHSYDETTHKCVCGAYDPAESSVKISVDVKEKTSKQFVGWWFWGTLKGDDNDWHSWKLVEVKDGPNNSALCPYCAGVKLSYDGRATLFKKKVWRFHCPRCNKKFIKIVDYRQWRERI